MPLVNQRTGRIVAETVELANTRRARRRGLLGRTSLHPEAAFVLSPCFSVHTAFMKFPIDVVFVSRDGVVQRVVAMPPWRAAVEPRARAVIEMAAGGGSRLCVGDRLAVTDDAEFKW